MATPKSITSLNNETAEATATESNGVLAQKRPAGDNPNNRPPKRRANRACLSCRNRKVRCDVVGRGQPCTNCRLDGVDCAVKESNRGRKPASECQHQVAIESRPATEPSSVTVALPRDELSPMEILSPPGQPGDDQHNNHFISSSCDGPDRQRTTRPPPPAISSDLDGGISPHDPRNSRLFQKNLSPISDHWVSNHTNSPGIPQRSSSLPRLPSYIRPVPPYLRQRDLQYLADSGALTIPDDAFRDELLRTYVHVVYPFMPAIDLGDFLGPIMNLDDRSPVSLLLFQAVMFAGVTFVDAKFLQARGYDSRKAARKAFFSRVRLLYGLDYEQDRLPLLQAVLLMTYWYDCPENDKDTWYWMGIALGLAQVGGYHREPSVASPKQRRLRRRIWWSCVIRDRLLALGVRRPSRIYNDDFRVEPLTVDDFDLHIPSGPLTKLLGDSRFVAADPSARSQLATICVELSKLCTCLGLILHTQYSLTGSQSTGSDYLRKAVVVPKESDTQLQDLAMCDKELDKWLVSQDVGVKYVSVRTPRDGRGTIDEATRVIQLHQAQLHMIYLTTITVLHKPQVFFSSAGRPDNEHSHAQKRTSKTKIMEAAVAIANLAHSLKSNDQLRFLSTSSVPAFLSASLIHLMDTRSLDDDIRSISIGRFCQCVGALQQLQDIYTSADYAIYFLRDVLKNANIDVPMVKLALQSRTSDDACDLPPRASRSTSNCPSSSTRVWTPSYPSQPVFQSQQPFYPELPLGRDLSSLSDSSIVPMSQNLLDGQFNALSAANLFSGVQESGDIIFDPSAMSNWFDIDITVPPTANFEVDGNPSVLNTTTFM